MAKHRDRSGEERRLAEGVAASLGGGYWSVSGGRWPTVRPGLPPHLVDLLAPPIVVGVSPVAAAPGRPAGAAGSTSGRRRSQPVRSPRSHDGPDRPAACSPGVPAG